MIHTHTTIRGLIPVIYLTNIISPLYVYCHQHQNMIKGMIALSQPLRLGPKKVEAMLLTGRFMQHNEERGGYIKDEANLAGK